MKRIQLLSSTITLLLLGSFNLFAITASSHDLNNINIKSKIDAIPLITSLYYNETDITSSDIDNGQSITQSDWNVKDGFTTEDFTVSIAGTVIPQDNAKKIQVTISASPFYLKDSEETVYAGKVKIIHNSTNLGTVETNASDSATAPSENEMASITIVSDKLEHKKVYTGYTDTSASSQTTDGKVVSFSIGTEGTDRNLPTGQYVSNVTMFYSVD